MFIEEAVAAANSQPYFMLLPNTPYYKTLVSVAYDFAKPVTTWAEIFQVAGYLPQAEFFLKIAAKESQPFCIYTH